MPKKPVDDLNNNKIRYPFRKILRIFDFFFVFLHEDPQAVEYNTSQGPKCPIGSRLYVM
jgi:hypothetical protein